MVEGNGKYVYFLARNLKILHYKIVRNIFLPRQHCVAIMIDILDAVKYKRGGLAPVSPTNPQWISKGAAAVRNSESLLSDESAPNTGVQEGSEANGSCSH